MHGFAKILLPALLMTPLSAWADFDSLAFDVKQFYQEQCAECHGANGISSHDRYPNVAGQKRMYTIKEMKDFQTGARPGTIMPSVMDGISEKDIEALATYMSKLKGRP